MLISEKLAQTSIHPINLEVDHAEGLYIYTPCGKRYMDMISGIGVSALGHGNSRIKEAIKQQIDKYMHVMVYGEFGQVSQNMAAELLTDMLPDSLDQVYFVNSGAEANEAALKLAKRVTGRTKIFAFRGAYHGSTHGALSVSGNEKKKYAFRPLLPDVHFLNLGDHDQLELVDNQCAAVILETIQGDAGVRAPSKEYMRQLRQKCDETGALLILDEIQCGLGRSGTDFAFELFGIEPDILTLGKSLGGGMPLGAVVAAKEKMSKLTYDPELGHITTFGGHPVIAASVAAFLEEYHRLISLSDVNEKGKRIAEKLGSHHRVIEIRQHGLFFAIDMGSAEDVNRVVEHCLDNGLISFWFLSCPSAFRIAPPLNISDEEIEKACEIILNAFNSLD